MRRYWWPQDIAPESFVNIDGEFFKHICVVCRQSQGDRFELITNDGVAHLVELIGSGKKSAQAKWLSQRELPPLPRPHIHLALSVSKLSTMENVIEKSVELGVQSLHIFRSDFSNIKGNTKVLSEKKGRLEKIIKSATQQSGRGSLMPLTLHENLGVLLETFQAQENALGLFAYEGEAPQSLSSAITSPKAKDAQDIWVFVGSEGGFSKGDVQLFSDSGMIPMTLGAQVLRVETACVTLVAVIKYGLGHFS